MRRPSLIISVSFSYTHTHTHTRALSLNFLPFFRTTNIFTWQRWLSIYWLACVNYSKKNTSVCIPPLFLPKNIVINKIVLEWHAHRKRWSHFANCDNMLANYIESHDALAHHKLIWFWIKIALWYRLHIFSSRLDYLPNILYFIASHDRQIPNAYSAMSGIVGWNEIWVCRRRHHQLNLRWVLY